MNIERLHQSIRFREVKFSPVTPSIGVVTASKLVLDLTICLYLDHQWRSFLQGFLHFRWIVDVVPKYKSTCGVSAGLSVSTRAWGYSLQRDHLWMTILDVVSVLS